MYIFNFTDPQKVLVQKMRDAYGELTAAKDTFIRSLRDDDLPAWTPSGGNARSEAAALYGDFYFPHEQSDESSDESSYNVVSKGCGLIGASPDTIVKAEKYNTAKRNFDTILNPMRGVYTEVGVEGKEDKPNVQMFLDRAALKSCGLSVLSERQACRQIKILESMPATVKFMWVSGNSSSKMTIAEVRSRLRDMSVTPDVAADLRSLDRLDQDEPLAIVKKLNPHLRVKFGTYAIPKIERVPKRKKVLKEMVLTYKQHATSMPVLVQMAAGESLPEDISGPRGFLDEDEMGDEEKKKSQQRRKLEQTPYLRTLNIYRYQEESREEVRKSEEWRKKIAKIY